MLPSVDIRGLNWRGRDGATWGENRVKQFRPNPPRICKNEHLSPLRTIFLDLASKGLGPRIDEIGILDEDGQGLLDKLLRPLRN
jgi:hypothetical protein